jgi:oligopeptide/dipeptide ABC transporter ATP-binding protein
MPFPLLEVSDLAVSYHDGTRLVVALDEVSLCLREGESLGILGESGCGKSTLALALLGLLPPAGEVVGGSVRWRGRELLGLGERELRPLRGAELSIVFQEPGEALHPTRRVGVQIEEVLRAHRRGGRRERLDTVRALLFEVGLEAPLADAYPHELSGGQRQRVVLAQALACRPALLVADEPTGSLDAVTRTEILTLLRHLRRRLGMSLLLISHDPQVLQQSADRLLVLYAGRRMEEGPVETVCAAPLHPYTEALLRCLPPLGRRSGGRRPLPVLEGQAPILRRRGGGCRFAPRCPARLAHCEERTPGAVEAAAGHVVECFLHDG